MASSTLTSLSQREVERVATLLGLVETAIHVAATTPDMLRIEGEEGEGEKSWFPKLLVTSQTVLLLFSPFTKYPLSTPSLLSSLYPPPPSSHPTSLLPSLLSSLLSFLLPSHLSSLLPSLLSFSFPPSYSSNQPGNIQLPPPALTWSHTTGMLTPLLHCLSSWVEESVTTRQVRKPRGFFPSHVLTRRSMDISVL